MSKPPPAFWQDPEGDGEDIAPPEPADDVEAADAPDVEAPDVDAPEVDGAADSRSADR
jgi:hypothetical protein